MIRVLAPKVLIWAGGPAFSLFAEQLMAEIADIDLGLKGEGETVVPRMLADPSRAKDLPGVVWRDDEKIRSNFPGEKTDMDTLPEQDFKAFPPEANLKGNMYVAAMGIEGKRGCDLYCGYCIYPCLEGHSIRLRNPIKIVDEMEWMHKCLGVRLFHFTDSVLNRPADHFEAVCREIINRKLDLQWTGFFREDCLSKTQCDLAIRAGLSAIYFSGDSLTDHGLALLGKRLTKDNLFHAFRMTVSAGILTMCHFLVNLPGEFPEHETEARDTLEKILDIHQSVGNLGAVILNTVRIYPDAPLTRRMLRKGWIDPRINLLYPVYYNPLATSHVLHQLEARCHATGS
jgi:anaerobic magnesium-protoporphyrin IX monomethyl ester cyclase